MKQTAVDWLVAKLKSQGLLIGEPKNLVAVRQAKEMEAEQMGYDNKHHQTEITDEELEKEILNFLYGFEYEVIPNSASYKFDYEACAKALTQRFKEILKNNETNLGTNG